MHFILLLSLSCCFRQLSEPMRPCEPKMKSKHLHSESEHDVPHPPICSLLLSSSLRTPGKNSVSKKKSAASAQNKPRLYNPRTYTWIYFYSSEDIDRYSWHSLTNTTNCLTSNPYPKPNPTLTWTLKHPFMWKSMTLFIIRQWTTPHTVLDYFYSSISPTLNATWNRMSGVKISFAALSKWGETFKTQCIIHPPPCVTVLLKWHQAYKLEQITVWGPSALSVVWLQGVWSAQTRYLVSRRSLWVSQTNLNMHKHT